MDLSVGRPPLEERTECFPVDATGAPVITECPLTGCEDTDLWILRAAGGKAWITVCAKGHLAFIAREEQP